MDEGIGRALPKVESALDATDRASGLHLYLDCFSGIAGDMFLGAMLDLGVPEEWISSHLRRLPIHGYEWRVGRRDHQGIRGRDVQIVVHDPGHHHHRYDDICQMIREACLPPPAEVRALAIFEVLARAEAKIHGMELAEVEFHEVGAVDSVLDVVGAALALTWLSPARVSSRAVPLGRGRTRSAHGILPVPSPAALEILRGAEVEDGDSEFELCTPTGAAIVATTVTSFGPMPRGRIVAVGYGAGDVSLADRPNHLRAVLVQDTEAPVHGDEVVLVETNIDDMSPELSGYLVERLLEVGALDAWHVPVVMKKGRPATQVCALCAAERQDAVIGVLLEESTAIGVRYQSMQRRTLERRSVTVDTAFGPVELKEGLDGGRWLNVAPEYDACVQVARRAGVPLKRVYLEALCAYWAGRQESDR